MKSTALLFGDKTKPILALFSGCTITLLTLSGMMAHLNWPYFLAMFLGGLHFGWQLTTLKMNDADDCMRKFVSNKWFGGLITAGIIASKFV